jgi:hypothetical protein
MLEKQKYDTQGPANVSVQPVAKTAKPPLPTTSKSDDSIRPVRRHRHPPPPHRNDRARDRSPHVRKAPPSCGRTSPNRILWPSISPPNPATVFLAIGVLVFVLAFWTAVIWGIAAAVS